MDIGKLYVVGTPIGNLGDMTPRAVQTLKQVDFIAAEDTRVTMKLLNYFDIKKQTVSYHEYNIHEKGKVIIGRLLQGENAAIVTDAGMPCISDPGEDLVNLAVQNGIDILVVPCACAAISALAISGMPTGRFCFEGFLSANKNSRLEHLNTISQESRTMIFYEAPHKLLNTLKDMLSVLGDRKISLCREITKMYEEVIRLSISEAIEYFTLNMPRGEFVLVLEGAKPIEKPVASKEEANEKVKELHEQGFSLSAAAKEVSKITGYKKSDLYKECLGK